MVTQVEPKKGGKPTATSYVPRILLRHLAEDPEATWWTTDGSVVFVDISGFTKLSEKLAKVGKEGAEQVTDAIEACFTDLLSVAYANDGSLIKFGGDALLLLFEGDDHVANACRSAVWMRRALRDVGRIEVPGSHVQLRMSVGVHTGTYHFFHVGGSHRELVVTGPGWTGTVGMEHIAEAGEILVSPQVAAALPPPVPRRSEGAGVPPEAGAAGPPRRGGDPHVQRRSGRGGALPVDGGADPRAGRRRHAGAPADLDRVHPLRRDRRDDRGARSRGGRRRPPGAARRHAGRLR